MVQPRHNATASDARIIASPHLDGATEFRLHGWSGAVADAQLREDIEEARRSKPRKGLARLRFAGEDRPGEISFKGREVHVHFHGLVHVVLGWSGRKPYVWAQARVPGILLLGGVGWIETCLGTLLRALASEQMAAAWSFRSNGMIPLYWTAVRLELALDMQGVSFDWDDARYFVAKQKHRALSKVPGQAGFDKAVERLFELTDRDYLLDLEGRGAEVQTFMLGSRKSRTSMSLHRKDLAVRANHGVAASASTYAEVLWGPSGKYDPSAPIWRVELRVLAEGLDLVEIGAADSPRRISPRDLPFLVSEEGVAILWEFATTRIKLRAPGTQRARQGLDPRWLFVQAGTKAPPFRVEQSRSRRARQRSLHDHLVQLVETHNRQGAKAASLMDRASELDTALDADRMLAQLVAYCRANGIGAGLDWERVARIHAGAAALGLDVRRQLYAEVDPVSYHVAMVIEAYSAALDDR